MPEQQRPNASDKPLLLPAGRGLPYNREAEVAVLGSILLEPEQALETVLTKLDSEEHFHSVAHQAVYRAVRRLSQEGGQHVDLVSLGDTLERYNELELTGGREYLMELMSSVVTAANVETYAEIVRQNSLLRRLIRTSSNIIQRCTDPEEDTASMLDEIESDITRLTGMEAGSEATPIADCVMGAVSHMESLHRGDEAAVGIQTGYADLDECITGLKPGEMFVLAARPSIGKTAFALNMTANMALAENPVSVGVFSLEMSRELLTLRFLCSEARVNLQDIREGAVARARWNEITEAAGRLRDAPICIDDTGNIDIVEMRAKARRMHRKYNVQVLVVDYLQLMKSSSGRNATRENEVAKNSMGIKSLAKELEVPIIVLAQLNRQAEQPGQRPKLSHLRESGSIEQDADVVALLHRDREAEAGAEDVNEMDAELIIAKHRNGPTGIIPLTFLKQFTRFESRARFGDEDVP